ncbi:MAG: transposase [Deltaproteobacteria bacterium]|nr:MAG: transposase [Deltaproteobacteria bacterium]
MALPRSSYVKDGVEGVYHCFSRCVRRAFLCGFDPVTQRDFSHRKSWIVDRLQQLAATFAIEVCAYAVMDTHHHSILRTRPDIVATWSDTEVATRWLTLFPHHAGRKGGPPDDQQISALALCSDRIAVLRIRLSSVSWFMGRLNEFIARAANKEDNVKGRFWESRFKCLKLLDHAAIAACMVYVDLNPIRAGLSATPEDSNFTSIQLRIRAWYNETMTPASVPREPNIPSDSPCGNLPQSAPSACWLCPIQSDFQTRGILHMTPSEYFTLVDESGRMLRSDKRGAIDPTLAPILLRIGANPQAWLDTVSCFRSRFRLAAGLLSSLRSFADQLGRRWFTGVTAARAAFASSLPQAG